MKLSLAEALDMIDQGLTPEEYHKRQVRIRQLSTERDFLEDAIEILSHDPRDRTKLKIKMDRLDKVNKKIEELTR